LIRLTDKMSPKLIALTREIRRILGLDKPIEVYQSAGLEEGNARAVFLEKVIAIEIVGRWIMSLDQQDIDERAMLAILGHEVGHHLCHHPHTMYGSIYRRAGMVYNHPFLAEVARAYRLAAELTADRFGLLACQDLDAALRLEMISTAGLQTSAMSWDTRSYLEDACDLMEQLYKEGQSAMGIYHPEHNMRAYAAWLYTESDAYCALTGREPGPDARPISEVDEVLSQLLGVERIQGRKPGPRPGPTVRTQHFGAGQAKPTGAPQSKGDPSKAEDASLPETPEMPMTREEKLRKMSNKAAYALGKAAGKVRPGLSQVTKGAGAGMGRLLGRRPQGAADPSPELDNDIDPLADDESDLMDRFAALEQKFDGDDFDLRDGPDDELDKLKRELGGTRPTAKAKVVVDDDLTEMDDDDVLARFAELERQVKKGT
jgi:hypothetical protein